MTPSASSTSSGVMVPSAYVTSLSSVPMASRNPPCEWRAMMCSASAWMSMGGPPLSASGRAFSRSTMPASRRTMSVTCGRWKSNRWQRETMVSGILCASVVARTNTTLSGGSSRVLSSALKASRVSMWTSSTM